MHVFVLIVVFSLVYGVVAWRWTRNLPGWLRPLTRALLLSLLFPGFVAPEDGAAFVPMIVRLTCQFGSLKPDDFKEIVIQFLCVWVVVYGLWLALASFGRIPAHDPVKMRRLELVAVVFSWPSWILTTGFIVYRFWIDGGPWPYQDLFTIPCVICVICSLVAMTIFLITMSEYAVRRSSFVWLFWSALPMCLALLIGCFLCFDG